MKILKKLISVIAAAAIFVCASVFQVQAADPKLNYRKDFDWGAVMHIPQMSQKAYNSAYLEEHIHLAAEMGSKLIRIDVGTNSLSYTDKLVRLANAYGMKVMIIIYIPDKTLDGEFDYELVEQHFRTFASRYDGTNGYGKADYIQVDNEMDGTLMHASSKGITGGQNITDYDELHLKTLTGQIKAALTGIKNSKTSAKSIINFGWTHWGMFDYFVKNGVEWDIIGYDWYSDMFRNTDNPDDFFWAGDIVYKKYKKKMIICETNMFGKTADFNEENASSYDPLVKCMQDYYEKDYVIGCTFYELCDELERDGDTYNQEAHFGLLYTDKETGAVVKPKPIYNRIKNIIGGSQVKKLDWEKVLDSYKDNDDEEPSDQKNNNSSVTQSNSSSKVTQSTVVNGNNENISNISPESSYVDSSNSGGGVTHIELQENTYNGSSANYKGEKILTTPVIICIIVAAVVILATIAVAVFLVVRKPKLKENTLEKTE